MKAWKRILAVGTLTALLLAALSGCGGSAGTDYTFEAEKAVLTGECTLESGQEYTDKLTSTQATHVANFKIKGDTITFNINADKACSATLTLRAASACAGWDDDPIVFEEVDLSKGEHATLSVNGTDCALSGKLPGLTAPMDWNVLAAYYKHYGTATAKIDLQAGENVIVLTAQGYKDGAYGINVDKITINSSAELTWTETDNSNRIS